jgi:phosphatidylglycerophosphate synthase
MIGPSSSISKFLLTLLVFLVIFYAYLDIHLFLRIQNYPIDRNLHKNGTLSMQIPSSTPLTPVLNYSDVTWVNCHINPLCDVTVKALMLDHTNHYIFAPLATLFDDLVMISRSDFITPNMISFFHVFVACLAGKAIASDSLGYRRLGVVLFQIRTFLDDLDGHVARVKRHIRGERSEIGTTGYYVDGLCDGLGCIALMIGIFVFLRNNVRLCTCMNKTNFTIFLFSAATTRLHATPIHHSRHRLQVIRVGRRLQGQSDDKESRTQSRILFGATAAELDGVEPLHRLLSRHS